jgi:SAM-dependent methyltransferase
MSDDPKDLSAQNKRAWDRLYGSTDHLIWGDAPTGFLPEALRDAVAGLPSKLRVLDAGTGEGRNLELLLGIADEVHACDASDHALQKIPTEVAGRVQARHCDLAELPYEEGSFDLVLAVDVVETLPVPAVVLLEFSRVLRAGGMLVCNIPGPEDGIAGVEMEPIDESSYLFRGRYFYQFLEEPQAVALLSACGLEVRSVRLHTWTEPAHPNFRDAPHSHTSRVFIAERVI